MCITMGMDWVGSGLVELGQILLCWFGLGDMVVIFSIMVIAKH